MSDWIIHLGIGYLFATLIRAKRKNLVLLGSILPDVARLNYVLIDVLGISNDYLFALIEPLHTPFMMLLVSLLAAQFFDRYWHSFTLIFSATLLHFGMDIIDARVANGVMVFYPFSMWGALTELLWVESTLAHIIRAGCVIALLYALYSSREWVVPTLPKSRTCLLLLILSILIVPLLTAPWYPDNGQVYLDFFTHPENWEGREVGLLVTEVTAAEPGHGRYIIKEMGREYFLLTGQKLSTGQWISVRGTYSHSTNLQPTITASFVKVHQIWIKTFGSLAGLGLFLLIWFKLPLKQSLLYNHCSQTNHKLLKSALIRKPQ